MSTLSMANHLHQRGHAYRLVIWFTLVLIPLLFLGWLFNKGKGSDSSKLGISPLRTIDHASGCAFSPDGALLAVRRESHLDLVSVETGQVRLTLPAPGRRVTTGFSLAFSPDGRFLAVGCEQHVDIRRILTGMDPRIGKKRYEEAFDKALDSARAASTWVDVWDTHTWRIRARLTADPGVTEPLVFSPDGTMLITGRRVDMDVCGTVTLWNTANWRPLRSMQSPLSTESNRREHVPMAAHIIFSPNSQLLFTAGVVAWDVPPPGAYLRDVPTGKMVRCFSEDRDNPIYSAAFTPDGKEMISAGDHITRWDTVKWKPLSQSAALRGDVVLSPDGKFLALDGFEGQLLYASTLAPIGDLGRITACKMDFSPDSRILAVSDPYYQYPDVSGQYGKIQLWRIRG